MADLKASTGAILLIILLSLATWVFFAWEEMPLYAAGTAVVVGAWAVVVLLGRRLWSHFRKDLAKK
jgi:hypothetical protein